GDALGGGDELFPGGHEGRHLFLAGHAAHAVVPAGDDAQELAGGASVVGDGHGGEAVLGLERQDVGEGGLGGEVGGAHHEAGLVVFHPGDHGEIGRASCRERV